MISLRPTSASDRATTRRWRLRLTALGIGVILGIIAAEVGLRLAGIGHPLLYRPDEFCGSRLSPGVAGRWVTEGRATVSINALGFRGPEIAAAKPAGVYRIAVLGDSFIEALQVDDELTFSRQLERRLNDAAESGRRYEVVNAGVSGYGTAQELQMLRHYVLPLEPDLVLLAFFPENDIRNNSRVLEGDAARPYFTLDTEGNLVLDDAFQKSEAWLAAASRYERFKSAVINRSRLLQALHAGKMKLVHGVSNAQSDDVETELSRFVQNAPYAYGPSDNADHQAAWEVTLLLIEEMARECRERDIEFAVFTVSSALQVHPDRALRERIAERFELDTLFYSEKRIAVFCEQRSIAFVPLASRLQSAVDDSDEYLHGFENTALGAGHWNERGHALAAEIVAGETRINK